jgi:hypothetical protein
MALPSLPCRSSASRSLRFPLTRLRLHGHGFVRLCLGKKTAGVFAAQNEPQRQASLLFIICSGSDHLHKLFYSLDTKYGEDKDQLTIPIGIATNTYNNYIEQLEVKPSVSYASLFTIEDLYALYSLYTNWGSEKEPWIIKVLFPTAIEFKFKSLLNFIESGLDKEDLFAGDFLEDLLDFLEKSDTISKEKKRLLISAIKEEPFSGS